MLSFNWRKQSQRRNARRRARRRSARPESLEQRVLLTIPEFTEVTGAANPYADVDLEIRQAGPTLVDLDDDGDLDLVIGHIGLRFRLLENIGSPTGPDFREQTLNNNPLSGILLSGRTSAAAFGDLDGDGDADLIGEGTFDFEFLENTGTAASAAFTPRTGVENPLHGISAGLHRRPTLGDIDGDGDLDLVTGRSNGVLSFIENTGTAETPTFVHRTGNDNPFAGISVYEDSAPTLGDLDGDGDIDLIVGDSYGTLSLFENTSSGFVAPSSSPLTGVEVSEYSRPVLGDLDGDGDLDLVVGEYSGSDLQVRVFENTGTAGSPSFQELSGTDNPTHGEGKLDYATPAIVDLDADGDLDLVIGRDQGGFRFLKNTGTATTPEISVPSSDPFVDIDAGERTSPTFGDLDGDGDFDMIAGTADGTLGFVENTGTPQNPSFADQTGASNPLDGIDVGNWSVPALGDIDGDHDLDLVVGHNRNGLHFFENTGSRQTPEFTLRTGAMDPFDGIDTGTRVQPTLVDIDGDGDTDLVFGSNLTTGDRHNLRLVENTGTPTDPEFTPRLGADNAFPQSVIGGDVLRPTFGDIDNDGDLDLIAGKPDGYGSYNRIRFFEASIPAAFREIEVSGNGVSLDGSSLVPAAENGTDFGTRSVLGGSLRHTFTIRNNGNVDLNLTGSPLVQLTGAAGSTAFSLATMPDAVVAPGGETTFEIEFDPDTPGEHRAVLNILSDDPAWDPFVFAVHGTGDAARRIELPSGSQPLDISLVGSTVEVRDGAAVVASVEVGAGADALRIVAGDAVIITLDSSLNGYRGALIYQGGPRRDDVDARALTKGVEFHGELGADRFRGGSGRDTAFGGRGRDVLVGGAGRDVLDGGPGNDRLFGKDGGDTLSGGDGHDRLVGGPQRDRLDGGAGNDRLEGRRHPDTLTGGLGNDTLDGGPRLDSIVETSGSFLLTDAALTSGSYTDQVTGIEAASLTGTPGNDTLDTRGFSGNVQLFGGAGNDVLLSGPRIDLLDGGSGDDTLRGGTGADSLSGGDGRDVLEGDNGLDNLAGGNGNDLLIGGNHADVLLGGPGDDTLRGGRASDVLLGESGDDNIDGEDGNDRATGGGNGTAASPGDVLSGVEETIDSLMHNFNWLAP